MTRLAAAACACALAATAAPALRAQSLSLRMLSEFRRLTPAGEIVAADRPGRPREIISPAAVRNGYTSFHIHAQGPPGKSYMLHVAQNPEGIIRPKLYRVSHDASGTPDALEPLAATSIPGVFPASGTAVYWLDLFTPADAPVRRVRVEAQLNAGADWVITPLEVRVLVTLVPPHRITAPGPLPPASAVSSTAAFGVLERYLCTGGAAAAETAPRGSSAAAATAPGIRAFIRRNALQDDAIARRLSRAEVEPAILKLLGAANGVRWCESHPHPDPETYLRVRDFLYRLAVN